MADRQLKVEAEPDRSHVELPRRRKVVPSWQQEQQSPSEQLELPVVAPMVTVELRDVEAVVEAAVDAAVDAATDEMVAPQREVEGEEPMPRKKKKPLDEAGKMELLARAEKAREAKIRGAAFESYAAIGKDYGIGAQGVANLVSRLRQRVAKKALKTAALKTTAPASSSVAPTGGSPAVKDQGLFLRFDRGVQVEIVGLDERIDARLKARMARFDEMIASKVKEGIAHALRKGIG
jgi:hypothetical protein